MIIIPKELNKRGFTIIELLIATNVLSVMLLLVTSMMIGIGNLYDKGINQSRVQDSVRSISDSLAQSLQFSNGNFTSDTANGVICAGNQRYTYTLHQNLGTQVQHVLWRDTLPSTGCTPSDYSTPGIELMAPNSRLAIFSVTSPTPGTYNVSIEEVYGDHSLAGLSGGQVVCNGGTGDQFCATASLNSTVVQRTQN